MFCSSCSQTYDSTFARCPECHGWLKATPSNKPPQAGWGTPTEEEDGWGWSSPTDAASTPKSGWAAPSPAAETEVEDGWNYQEEAPTARLVDELDSIVDDDWVDAEMEEDEESFYGELPEFTEAEPVQSGALRMVMVALCIFLGGVALLKWQGENAQPVDSPEVAQQRDALLSAEATLTTAREYQADGRMDLASEDYARALEFFKQAQTEPARLDEVARELAAVQEKASKLEAAHKTWTALGDPDETDRLAKLLRSEANATLETAARLQKQGALGKALEKADGALSLYLSYGGSAAQVASAQERRGRIYLAKNNEAMARAAFNESYRADATPARKALLQSLTVAVALPEPAPIAAPVQSRQQVVDPTFVEESDIPEGQRGRGRRRTSSDGGNSGSVKSQAELRAERNRAENARYAAEQARQRNRNRNSGNGERLGRQGEVGSYSSSSRTGR